MGDPLTRPAPAEENAGAVNPLPQGGEGRNLGIVGAPLVGAQGGHKGRPYSKEIEENEPSTDIASAHGHAGDRAACHIVASH